MVFIIGFSQINLEFYTAAVGALPMLNLWHTFYLDLYNLWHYSLTPFTRTLQHQTCFHYKPARTIDDIQISHRGQGLFIDATYRAQHYPFFMAYSFCFFVEILTFYSQYRHASHFVGRPQRLTLQTDNRLMYDFTFQHHLTHDHGTIREIISADINTWDRNQSF